MIQQVVQVPRSNIILSQKVKKVTMNPRRKQIPVLAVCGNDNSGKTALLVELMPFLKRLGLRVAVIRQDEHGSSHDRGAEVSELLFRAGADVITMGHNNQSCKSHQAGDDSLDQNLVTHSLHYDLILVEGDRTTPVVDKLWLKREDENSVPEGIKGIHRTFNWNENRVQPTMSIISALLKRAGEATPLRAGVLFGGRSRRMGQPKHLIKVVGTTWIERIVDTVHQVIPDVVLLGSGEIPAELGDLTVLPDVPRSPGPLAGMLSAMRWDPWSDWFFVACDMPSVSREAIEWLLSQRQEGVWSIIPRWRDNPEHLEPFLAWYHFRSAYALELCKRPADLAAMPFTVTPVIPKGLEKAWSNFNNPEELEN